MDTYRNLQTDDFNIKLNDIALHSLNEAPFLGVTIDKKLNYEEHIENTLKTNSKKIGIIFKLSKLKISAIILKQVFYNFI